MIEFAVTAQRSQGAGRGDAPTTRSRGMRSMPRGGVVGLGGSLGVSREQGYIYSTHPHIPDTSPSSNKPPIRGLGGAAFTTSDTAQQNGVMDFSLAYGSPYIRVLLAEKSPLIP